MAVVDRSAVIRPSPRDSRGVRPSHSGTSSRKTLPDLREEDIAGSGFAITCDTVHPDLGGDAALARIRQRPRDRGLAVDARLRAEPHCAG